jgi:hypothetical protein
MFLYHNFKLFMNLILKLDDVVRKVHNNFIMYISPQEYLNLLSWRLQVCNQHLKYIYE